MESFAALVISSTLRSNLQVSNTHRTPHTSHTPHTRTPHIHKKTVPELGRAGGQVTQAHVRDVVAVLHALMMVAVSLKKNVEHVIG
jgi:hypothetical protein